ncbi:DUF3472 domain-containing protein [Novipirellula artificiosorum]|uniref:DUF5077 domain-containing protein n=1 Tax=Novipirellula artificiosorum TaxID=2528016 RepID=A0A5C6DRQ6_9BACT|nr:hypothetical protein [Novipirellula artificiosorum]TWU38547.1 hypothetical protein Poly41_30240 [Novipirellula artificiosorum]
MIRIYPLLCCVLCMPAIHASAEEPLSVPDGAGQLETAPVLVRGGVDEDGREYYVNGQPAKNGKLILTASNGFFTPGVCRASGESSLPKTGDDGLIAPNYAILSNWKKTDGTIRWHLWLARPGQVRLNVHLSVVEKAAGSKLSVSFGGVTQKVKTVASRPNQPEPWNLAFEVDEPGEHTFEMAALTIANSQTGVGELHRVDVHGPAVEDSQLLRARWRPAAVHGGYASTKIDQSRMWVMATRSTSNSSSYSPITTPFGYYGTSFDASGRSVGGFNFSMWAARRGGEAPPLKQMPHLLAAGSPSAEFSGFGHEGSGVKLRGWTPMPDRPVVCVQALRVENDGDYQTYYGYFWDHPTKQWKLYAVGRKWGSGKPIRHLQPGSFCEVPGPPNVQRTGDVPREVRRLGWFRDESSGRWEPMDRFLCRGKGVLNKSWFLSGDGEFVMRTGGMRYYAFNSPPVAQTTMPLPEYLSPEATEQLQRLPAEFGEVDAVEVTDTTVNLDIVMKRAGTSARADIYYGEKDCLTFAKRELHATERGSAVSRSTQAEDRSWSKQVSIASLKDGKNRITITGLKPGTTWFYRILVTNDEGKLWTFETHNCRTSDTAVSGS